MTKTERIAWPAKQQRSPVSLVTSGCTTPVSAARLSRGLIGVESAAAYLRRIEFVHRRLVFLEAFHLVARSLWELKAALGRHLYEDAEAAARSGTGCSICARTRARSTASPISASVC